MGLGESIQDLKEQITFKEKQFDKVLNSIPDKIAVRNIRLILDQLKDLQSRLDTIQALNKN
jgi:hypothetical protein